MIKSKSENRKSKFRAQSSKFKVQISPNFPDYSLTLMLIWLIICIKPLTNSIIMRFLIYMCMLQVGVILGGNVHSQDVVDKVNNAIENADASELSDYFNTSLDISLPDSDQTMSKAHATQMMKSFFKKNPAKSYKVNHTGSSREATKYIIGTYISESKSYKTYILLKESSGKYLIVQLQFELE